MASKQIKIEKTMHEKVKDFVDKSSRYSSYKSFYEDAVRRTLDEEKKNVEELEQEINKLKEKLDM
jgi:Arc/MetJ-type ribon-helix-helix transcriptional regulator